MAKSIPYDEKTRAAEIAAIVEEVHEIQVSHWPASLAGSMNSTLRELQRRGWISLDVDLRKHNYFVRYAFTGSPVFVDNGGTELIFHELALAIACRDLYHQRYMGKGGQAPDVMELK